MKIHLTLPFVILIFLTTPTPMISPARGASTIVTVADVVWGSPGNPVEVASGDSAVPLSVTFVNTRRSTITSIVGLINLTEGFTNSISPSNRTVTSSFAGSVPSGGVFALRFLLSLTKDVRISDHSLPLEVEFTELGIASTITEDFVITVPVTGRSTIETRLANIITSAGQPGGAAALSETATLSAGGDTDIALLLVNTGSAKASLLDITLSIPPGTPISFVGTGGNWFIESLAPGASKSLPFKLHANPLAVKSAFSLIASAAYRDTYGMARVITRTVGVSVGSPAVEEISIEAALSPTVITAGLASEVKLILSNQGKVAAHSLDLSLGLPQAVTSPLAILGGAGHWTLDRLDPRQTANLTLTLYSSSSASSAAYQLPLSVRYQDVHGNSLVATRVLGIFVQGLIKMSVFETSFGYIGGSPTISGNLLNEGNVAALFTTISIVAPPGSGLAPKESIYIGDLTPNALQPFTISLSVPTVTSPTQYSVTIVVAFKDELRVGHVEEFPASIIVTPSPEERVTRQPTPFEQFLPASLQQSIVPALIGVVVGILIGLRRKRKSSTEAG